MTTGLKRLLLAALYLGLVSGGATRPAGAEAPKSPIWPGDVLQVSVYAGGAEQENFTAQVAENGTIPIPLLGDVTVAGMDPAGAADYLEKRLSRGYYVNPHVVISVKEYSGKVYVLGEVRRPGVYGIREAPTALSACIVAGGFTDFAAENRILVTRAVNGRTQSFKVDARKVRQGKQADLYLLPGDRIEVPHRRF